MQKFLIKLEPASGIEPPTCGLRISGKGLSKSLTTWAIPALHAVSLHVASCLYLFLSVTFTQDLS